MSFADFFSSKLKVFERFFRNAKNSESQTVLIQIRPDKTSGLIWVQTVCKGYQQTTLADKNLKDEIIVLMNTLKPV